MDFWQSIFFQGVAPVHENPGSPTKTKQAVAGLDWMIHIKYKKDSLLTTNGQAVWSAWTPWGQGTIDEQQIEFTNQL